MKPEILVVDDDSDYSRTLKPLLELGGYAVEAAESVDEAKNAMKGRHFDVAIVDLRLTNNQNHNDISGLEVVKEGNDYCIPCIIVTAHDSPEAARDSLRARGVNPPAVDYIPKGYGPASVLRSIQELRGLTLLTISDLHLRKLKGHDEPFDQKSACDDFVADVKMRPGIAFNKIEAIIVAGDISYQCSPESFNMARRFLVNLCDEFDVPKEHVVLIPGNHDVNRSKASLTKDHLLAMQNHDDIWFSKFDDYLEFTRYFYSEPSITPTKMYRILELGRKVPIVAFNSCLIEGEESSMCPACLQKATRKEHYHGWINTEQIIEAGMELDRLGWDSKRLRIGVFHHHVISPKTYPQKGCRGDHLFTYELQDHLDKFTFFNHGFRILLHGHRHKAKLQQSSVIGANIPYVFGSGALWMSEEGLDETANYLLLQLSPSPGNSHIIMRRYFPAIGIGDLQGGWANDPYVGRNGFIRLPHEIAI